MIRSAFVDPVFLILVTGLLGLLVGLRWRALGSLIMLLSLLSLYALSTEYVSSRLLAAVEKVPPVDSAADGDSPPGAIVALSGGLRKSPPEVGGDTVGEDTLERVRMVAQLERQTGLPVLVSGGPVPGATKTLARTMAETLQRDFGVTAAWEEGQSQTTFENAKFSAQILGASGINRIYLVTHAAHMPRSVEIFERWGLHVIPVPTGFTMAVGTPSTFSLVPRSYYLAESGRAVREMLGTELYRLVYE